MPALPDPRRGCSWFSDTQRAASSTAGRLQRLEDSDVANARSHKRAATPRSSGQTVCCCTVHKRADTPNTDGTLVTLRRRISRAVVAAVSASTPISLSIPLSSPPVALKTLSSCEQWSVRSSPQMVPHHEVVFVRDRPDRFPWASRFLLLVQRSRSTSWRVARLGWRRFSIAQRVIVGGSLLLTALNWKRCWWYCTEYRLILGDPLARDFRRDGEVLSCCARCVPASSESDSVQFGERVSARLTAAEELMKDSGSVHVSGSHLSRSRE